MVTMKIDPLVYEKFKNLSIITEDGVTLVTSTQKIAYLTSFYIKASK